MIARLEALKLELSTHLPQSLATTNISELVQNNLMFIRNVCKDKRSESDVNQIEKSLAQELVLLSGVVVYLKDTVTHDNGVIMKNLQELNEGLEVFLQPYKLEIDESTD